MYWANFIHIYQPPTQTEYWVRRITDECYRKLVRVLNESPAAKVTLNINAVLTGQLDQYGLTDVIAGFRKLAERGQVEFTASAIYHPILPLIPVDEARRQIELNTQANRRYFGDVYQPRGFFPPEMCYGNDLPRLVRDMGFQWMIVDEIGFNGRIGSVRDDVIYSIDEAGGLPVFFKERPFSAGITYGSYPDSAPFVKALGDRLEKHWYLLTGTDGEVYGHHRPGQEKLLQEMWALQQPRTCFVSDLEQLFTAQEGCHPRPSSWSTWEDEMAQGIPYPQWSYPGHELHALQWRLAHLVLEAVRGVPAQTARYDEARHQLDEGLHSCQFWWASCRPWWDTGMVEWGATKLFDAVDVLQPVLSQEVFQEVSAAFSAVVQTARRWQESGEARRRKEEYLREHGQVSSELTFGGGLQ